MLYRILLVLFLVASGCGKNNADDLKNNLDLARDLMPNNPEVMRMLASGNFTAITQEFGTTVIDMQQLPYKSAAAQSSVTPWSSWWFPKKEILDTSDGSLVSALEKYDEIRAGNEAEYASAAEYEKENFNANVFSWEGLCDAWAIASVSAPEPKRGVIAKVGKRRIAFSVSDLKALLLKTYEAVDDHGIRYYGQKFVGDSNSWVYPDVFPEQFHRFMEVQLFQRQKAFIMDHDPGVEVWNVPIYKANYILAAVPGDDNAVFVRTWVYSAESAPTADRNYVGTKEAVREYNYILKGTRSGSQLIVNSGYWVKGPTGIDSRRDHPDYLMVIPDPQKLVRKSWNPNIDIAVVDKILENAY